MVGIDCRSRDAVNFKKKLVSEVSLLPLVSPEVVL